MYNIPVITVLFSLSWIVGMVIFSVYANCDPLTSGYIKKFDEILPFFVEDRFNYLPGILGLFMASLFNGALRYLLSHSVFPEVLDPYTSADNLIAAWTCPIWIPSRRSHGRISWATCLAFANLKMDNSSGLSRRSALPTLLLSWASVLALGFSQVSLNLPCLSPLQPVVLYLESLFLRCLFLAVTGR